MLLMSFEQTTCNTAKKVNFFLKPLSGEPPEIQWGAIRLLHLPHINSAPSTTGIPTYATTQLGADLM